MVTRLVDETWEWYPRAGGGARLYSTGGEEEWATTWGRDNDARAQLAAQAPAMARLLMRLACEWPGTDGACQQCGSYSTQAHGRCCPIGDVLRAAGVAP